MIKNMRAIAVAAGIGAVGAGLGYVVTPKAAAESREPAVRAKESILDRNPELGAAGAEITRILIHGGINSLAIEQARQNPEQPIPTDWWLIIIKFITMGVGLSIDVMALTILMKNFSKGKEKLAWLLSVPALHFVLPELSGNVSSSIFDQSTLSFVAAACFFVLIGKIHQEEKNEDDKQGAKGLVTRVTGMIEKVLGGTVVTAASVSMDSLAAGPVIAEQSAKLGTSTEVANSISAATVLVCVLIAIGLQKSKDKLLKLINSDKAEIYGKALATGAFVWFLLDCLYTGLDSTFGLNLTPEQVNSLTIGLASIAPVASVMFLERQAAMNVATVRDADE